MKESCYETHTQVNRGLTIFSLLLNETFWSFFWFRLRNLRLKFAQ